MMNLPHLRRRAELLDQLRTFFRGRGFLEVETPLLTTEAIPERHIDLMPIAQSDQWLQASPEMHHKRLLCEGSGPIFEISRSFRVGERGAHHRPEFALLEWYRPGDDMLAGMALLEELIQTVLEAPQTKRTTYREAFVDAIDLDPHRATLDELRARATSASGVSVEALDRDGLLNLLLSARVEPRLGRDVPELLHHYPASQAALATTFIDARGDELAERFELYWRGLELANGYHELTDPIELRGRLERANAGRLSDRKPALPMPEKLLDAMTDPGLPPCAGVAVGVDRLVMIATGADTIGEVRAF